MDLPSVIKRGWNILAPNGDLSSLAGKSPSKIWIFSSKPRLSTGGFF
jgi:hypothetical protein